MELSENEARIVLHYIGELEDDGIISIDDYTEAKQRILSDTKIQLYGTDYYKYLQSEEWYNFRQKILLGRGGMCEICNSTDNLRVHHITYENGVKVKENDVCLLCDDCHRKVHEIMDEYQIATNEYVSTRESLFAKTISAWLASQMADLINEHFPKGIIGKNKARAVSIIRNSYSRKHPNEMRSNYELLVQQVNKK